MTQRINFSIESEGSGEAALAATQAVIDILRAAGLNVSTRGVNRRPIGQYRASGEIYFYHDPAELVRQNP